MSKKNHPQNILIGATICLSLLFVQIFFVPRINAQVKEKPLFPCTSKLDSPYGINASISRAGYKYDYRLIDKELSLIKEAGFQFVRFDLDCNLIYNLKTKAYSPSRYDEVFKKLSENNILGLPILSSVQYKHYNWDYPSDYTNYLSYVVNRYGVFIPYIEDLNEIDRIGDVKNLSKKYIRHLKQTRSIVNRINNSPKTLSTSITLLEEDVMQAICRKKGYNYFDIFNFHTYWKPEDLPIMYKKIKKLMDKYKWEKPVWLTETGFITKVNSTETDTEQAKRIARANIISFAYGVDKLFWYNLRASELKENDAESYFGLLHKNLNPKEGYYAYKYLIQMCPSGSTRPILTICGKHTYIAQWTKPDGMKVWAVWNPKDVNKTINIPLNAKAYNYLGKKLNINKSSITLSDGVIFITNAEKLICQ